MSDVGPEQFEWDTRCWWEPTIDKEARKALNELYSGFQTCLACIPIRTLMYEIRDANNRSMVAAKLGIEVIEEPREIHFCANGKRPDIIILGTNADGEEISVYLKDIHLMRLGLTWVHSAFARAWEQYGGNGDSQPV